VKLNISISGKNESERLISIIELGLLSAIENQLISIEEAEGYLFNPLTVSKLEACGLDEKVIEIIKEGCELEDIQSLVPEKMSSNIKRLKEKVVRNITSIESPELPTEKIVD
jgi:RNA binding exosome subunit